MKRDKLYISTISTDAVRVAQGYGLGLEIAEYCTAWNMDEKFAGVCLIFDLCILIFDTVLVRKHRGLTEFPDPGFDPE